MQFRLVYEGQLPANGNKFAKQVIRRALHPQLKELWTHAPLDHFADEWLTYPPQEDEHTTVVEPIGGFKFAPLICEQLSLLAELDVVLLRPTRPGALLRQSGDMDNQLKTLFDAFRVPHNTNEIPNGDAPGGGENPFHCLLDDDERIVRLSVETDRYLAPPSPESVRAEIFVQTRPEKGTWANLPLA
jgi:hypothetical protein